ncbi:putative Endoplasmic reticulum chaperone BiP [Seiridium cardinale]
MCSVHRDGVVTGNDIDTQMISDPSNTICGVKSLLGRKWSDPELQSIINGLDYRVVQKDDNPMILTNINGTETMMSPERVQGFLFRKMKAIAEQLLEHDVTNIFVPVPSNYNEVQRQAVKDSALEANLTVLHFIKDSSAAIMAYGLDRADDERLVLVYETGTSGSHASVASIEQGFIEPLGTTTDSFGGESLTNQVADV